MNKFDNDKWLWIFRCVLVLGIVVIAATGNDGWGWLVFFLLISL